MTSHQPLKAFRFNQNGKEEKTLNLIKEEPLSIRIQGNPYTVIMRTPGDEIAHVAGFCLGEGLVSSPEDFATLAYCEDDVNVVTATLVPERQIKIAGLLSRRGFISQTSCGICGRELIEDMKQYIPSVESGERIAAGRILAALNELPEHQPLRDRTRASHGAALFRPDGSFIACAEDVGRHNALDKVVGKLFMENRLHEAGLLILSSRTSYELVQKAGRANIPVVAGISRPTSFAVDLARSLGITLACLDGSEGLLVYCGHERVYVA